MRTAPLVAVTVALGAVLGAAAAEAVDGDLDDARRLAVELVPADARLVQVDEHPDFPLLGRTAFVVADVEGATLAQLRAQALRAQATVEDVQVLPGGTRLRGHRGPVELLVTVQPPSSATISTTPTGPSRTLWASTGAALLPLVAMGAGRARRRRSTTPADGPRRRPRDEIGPRPSLRVSVSQRVRRLTVR